MGVQREGVNSLCRRETQQGHTRNDVSLESCELGRFLQGEKRKVEGISKEE